MRDQAFAELRRAALHLLCLWMIACGAQAHGDAPTSPRPPAAAGSPPFWSTLPAIVPGGARAERGKASLVAFNIASTDLLVYNPNQPDSPVKQTLEGKRWLVAPASPDKGGHHWLMARETLGNETVTATTAWTFPAKGDAPTRLLQQSRGGLEITPDRIPEHGGMREGEDWTFHVRFDGMPLAGSTVKFETEAGTRSLVVTDAQGIARVAFPRDINPADIDPQAGATRTRKGFILAAEHQADGVRHLSAFNFYYYPDLMRERNLSGGFGFLALGMLLALPLLRRKETDHA